MSELKACIEELERHQKSLERKQLYPAALAMQGAIEIVKRHFPRSPRPQGVGKQDSLTEAMDRQDAERYRALRLWHDSPNLPDIFNLDEAADALIEQNKNSRPSLPAGGVRQQVERIRDSVLAWYNVGNSEMTTQEVVDQCNKLLSLLSPESGAKEGNL